MTRHTDPPALAAPLPGPALPDPPSAAVWRRVPVLLLTGSLLIAGSALLGPAVMLAVTLSLTVALMIGVLLLTRWEERRSAAWVHAAAGHLTQLSAADLNAHLARLSAEERATWLPPLPLVLFAPALLLVLPPVVVVAVLVWGALATWGARVFAARVVRAEQVSVLREALLRLE